jgi:PDZ domain-containing protein
VRARVAPDPAVAGSTGWVAARNTTQVQAATTTTTMNPDTRTASVPVPTWRDGGTTRRFALYWITFGTAAGLFATALVLSGFLKLPYFSFAPGNAYDTTTLVQVGGDQATFSPDGHLYFLTVRLPHVTVAEAALAWADRDQDIIRREGILRGLTDAQNRAAQAAAMTGSANDAIAVALDRLGIPRTPSGSGAVITGVVEEAPAFGLVDVADVIVGVDGQPVATTDDLTTLISGRAPGTAIVLDVEAFDGERRDVSVTLAPRPDDPARGFFGVETQSRDFDPGSPFPIAIDAGGVGGPSAGLAFTLAIIDVLTEGDLTGGRNVAITGTIDLRGNVGPVGGVAQKSAAAAGVGAEILLVPSGEEAEAQRLGYDLEVIGVDTLEEALAALEAIGGDPLPAPSPT